MTEITEICSIPGGRPIVGIVQHRDEIIIATDERIYRLAFDGGDYDLRPITFRDPSPGPSPEDNRRG